MKPSTGSIPIYVYIHLNYILNRKLIFFYRQSLSIQASHCSTGSWTTSFIRALVILTSRKPLREFFLLRPTPDDIFYISLKRQVENSFYLALVLKRLIRFRARLSIIASLSLELKKNVLKVLHSILRNLPTYTEC